MCSLKFDNLERETKVQKKFNKETSEGQPTFRCEQNQNCCVTS